jgi:transcriptional regulator with XRE-family HTH domain
MNDIKTKRRFIDLRSDGMSLKKIADELGVCRQTLANWENELQEEIWRMESMKLDALEEEYRMKRQGRIKVLGTMYNRIIEEIERRDLSDVDTARLFNLGLKIMPELKKQFSMTPLMSDQDVALMMLNRDMMEHPRNVANPHPPRRTPISTLDTDGSNDDEDGAARCRDAT